MPILGISGMHVMRNLMSSAQTNKEEAGNPQK